MSAKAKVRSRTSSSTVQAEHDSKTYPYLPVAPIDCRVSESNMEE